MSQKFKVLLLDNVDDVCKDIIENKGIDAVLGPKMTCEDVLKAIPDYHGLVVRSATKVDRELLDAATNLKVVGRAGVGIDNIDLDYATEKGVLVMNTPDGNTISTAEHACGLILSLVRNIPNAVASLKAGRWDRKKYLGTEVHGKTLGIIGLGKIGSAVAERMNGFGMRIIGYDPYMTHDRARELGIDLTEVDTVLSESDIITVHTPLTEKTKNLISRQNADKLKKGVRLVNCARGGIFNEEDLLGLLDDGTIAELALDVYSVEPPGEDLHPLLQHPNVVCTPHLGASTEEAQEKVAVQIAEQLADALHLRSFKGSLNGKSIALSTNDEVQPFLKLAENLGKFVQQIGTDNTRAINIEYSGTCEKYSEVLTDAILAGYLYQVDEIRVNLINARFIAKQKGLQVQETKGRESRTFSDLITVELQENHTYRRTSATPFSDNDYRIVDIDGFPIELQLKGEIILYKNIDRPGMLAAVSGLLASNEMNIASLSLGRELKENKAITAVVVDKRPDAAILEQISGIDGVEHLKYVSVTQYP